MEKLTKSGKFSIKTRLIRQLLKVLMRILASTSTDHSTLYHNFHLTESLKQSVLITLSSRDGERMLLCNNSGSMRSQRLLEATTGKTIALIFKAMVDQATLELPQVSTQDGGNCSRRTVNSLSTRRVKYLMSMVV
jgi:hypothetical protein